MLAVAPLRFLDVETQQALLTYVDFSPARVSTFDKKSNGLEHTL